MPAYGASMAVQIGEAVLLLCLQDVGDRTVLTRRIVQLGIDFYSLSQTGKGWPGFGGHGPGRKFPILLAGRLLGDEDMLAIGQQVQSLTGLLFAEDETTFYVSQEDLGRVLECVHSGMAQGGSSNTIRLASNHPSNYSAYVIANRIYLVSGTGAGQMRVATGYDTNTKVATVSPDWDTVPDSTTAYEVRGYEEDMIGVPEWGIEHLKDSRRDNPSVRAAYRSTHANSILGHILAARVFALIDEWNNEVVFEYQDRYWELTDPQGPFPRVTGYLPSFVKNMWERYRIQY